jgi:hypothetical protein
MIIVILIKIFEKSGKILEKKSTSKKMSRPLSSSLFYNFEVQASVHDFYYFHKKFGKIWKNFGKKKSTSKKMLRPLSSSLFYSLEVQASAHDFCNFNKFIGKIRKFEKS